MGDSMSYTCIACSETTMGIFLGKEKALFLLFEMSEEQQSVFLYSFIGYEMISNCLHFYKEEYLEILENKIYYKNHWLAFHKYKVETDDIYANILFDYMKRVHRIWCCKDESGKVIWIKTCKVIENCVK